MSLLPRSAVVFFRKKSYNTEKNTNVFNSINNSDTANMKIVIACQIYLLFFFVLLLHPSLLSLVLLYKLSNEPIRGVCSWGIGRKAAIVVGWKRAPQHFHGRYGALAASVATTLKLNKEFNNVKKTSEERNYLWEEVVYWSKLHSITVLLPIDDTVRPTPVKVTIAIAWSTAVALDLYIRQKHGIETSFWNN